MEDHFTEFEAKTVDEAIILAMKTLHVDFEALEIEVLSEGSKGILGIVGARSARIRVRIKGTGQDKAIELQEESPERTRQARTMEDRGCSPAAVTTADSEVLGQALETTSRILSLMGMDTQVKIRDDGMLEIAGDGSGLIIGKHGQTLDALQFIVNRITNKSRREPVHITLDTEGYRRRHIDHLKSLALKMGQKAKKTGQSVTLEKMNPYDRRIIHLTLKDERTLDTRSMGEGVYKKVVIIPKRAPRR
jgi:spoIIIJ-associated protein